MGTELTGKKPKDTYTWLMHMGEPGPLDSTPRSLMLGDGTTLPVRISTDGIFADNLNAAQTAISAGNPSFYFDATASLADNLTLSTSPSAYAEVANAKISISSELTFFKRFVSQPLGVTSIPAGSWVFDLYAATSNAAGNSRVKFRVNKRVAQTGVTGTWTGTGPTRTFTASEAVFTAGMANADRLLAALVETPNQTGWITAFTSATEVTVYLSNPAYVNESGVALNALYEYLFDAQTAEIDATTPTLYQVTCVRPEITGLGDTDRLVIALFAFSDAGGGGRTITLYYGGSTRYSHFEAPIAASVANMTVANLTASTTLAINATTVTFGTGAAAAFISALGAAGSVTKALATDSAARNTGNTGTTYTNDDVLAGWTIKANTNYLVSFVLVTNCTAATGAKVLITTPSSAFAGSYTPGMFVRSGGVVYAAHTATELGFGGTGAANGYFSGSVQIRTGATGGTANLQWALNTAAAGDVKLLAGSFVTFIELP